MIFSDQLMERKLTTEGLSPAVQKHIIYLWKTVRDALLQLNELHSDAVLFVCDENNRLLGSLTDGDLRRGFISGLGFEDSLADFIQPNPLCIYLDELHLADTRKLRKNHFLVIPILDRQGVIREVLNLRTRISMIPADVIIMAGGKGSRLMPLTAHLPKPLLTVGNKPILEHNIERLAKYGLTNIQVSVHYRAEQIMDYCGDGSQWGVSLSYIQEEEPLGTFGAVKLATDLMHEYVLIMNSDVLTNLDILHFFQTFVQSGADMAVATVSYKVHIPYGVLEVGQDNFIQNLVEKPQYTYQSNAGIYLMKRELFSLIPEGAFYDVTDMMSELVRLGRKVISFPIVGYWRDIGKHEDYEKAQEDIRYLCL